MVAEREQSQRAELILKSLVINIYNSHTFIVHDIKDAEWMCTRGIQRKMCIHPSQHSSWLLRYPPLISVNQWCVCYQIRLTVPISVLCVKETIHYTSHSACLSCSTCLYSALTFYRRQQCICVSHISQYIHTYHNISICLFFSMGHITNCLKKKLMIDHFFCFLVFTLERFVTLLFMCSLSHLKWHRYERLPSGKQSMCQVTLNVLSYKVLSS